MANTSLFFVTPDSSTDGNFRAWGLAISNALTAVGLTMVTDANQINWGGVAHPTSTNQVMGYEMRQFTDALQSGGGSNPIYIKFEYAGGVTDVAAPTIQITVGQSQNGSGTLGGTVSTKIYCGAYAANTTANTFLCFVSSDGGRINLALFINSGYINIATAFYVERTKNSSGTPTADGVNIGCLSSTATTAAYWQYLPSSGALNPASPSTPMCCAPGGPPTSAAGTAGAVTDMGINCGMYPIFPNRGYPDNPDMGAFVYNINDFGGNSNGAGALISVSIYGSNHMYVLMGKNYAGTNTTLNGATAYGVPYFWALAVRYE